VTSTLNVAADNTHGLETVREYCEGLKMKTYLARRSYSYHAMSIGKLV
jgi:hypothetical protein